jgi:hypothetical protein
MFEQPWEREPYPGPEDEGLPDLEDGTPEARWAEDPQEMPLPGERPTAADDYGVTADEQRTEEPLDRRLSREEADAEPDTEPDSELEVAPDTPPDTQLDTELDPQTAEEVSAESDTESAPRLDAESVADVEAEDLPRPAGRLVEEDEGAHTDTESHAVAAEVEEDTGGRTPEERAMRVEPE